MSLVYVVVFSCLFAFFFFNLMHTTEFATSLPTLALHASLPTCPIPYRAGATPRKRRRPMPDDSGTPPADSGGIWRGLRALLFGDEADETLRTRQIGRAQV